MGQGLEFREKGRRMDEREIDGRSVEREGDMGEFDLSPLDFNVMSLALQPMVVVRVNDRNETDEAETVYINAAKTFFKKAKLSSCITTPHDFTRLTLKVSQCPSNAKDTLSVIESLNSIIEKTHPQFIGYFSLKFEEFRDEN